jgi:hypothetical protein
MLYGRNIILKTSQSKGKSVLLCCWIHLQKRTLCKQQKIPEKSGGDILSLEMQVPLLFYNSNYKYRRADVLDEWKGLSIAHENV